MAAKPLQLYVTSDFMVRGLSCIYMYLGTFSLEVQSIGKVINIMFVFFRLLGAHQTIERLISHASR